MLPVVETPRLDEPAVPTLGFEPPPPVPAPGCPLEPRGLASACWAACAKWAGVLIRGGAEAVGCGGDCLGGGGGGGEGRGGEPAPPPPDGLGGVPAPDPDPPAPVPPAPVPPAPVPPAPAPPVGPGADPPPPDPEPPDPTPPLGGGGGEAPPDPGSGSGSGEGPPSPPEAPADCQRRGSESSACGMFRSQPSLADQSPVIRVFTSYDMMT